MLYWRDGLEVIKFIYSNPVFANCMDHRPYQLRDPKQNNQRVYGDFMSADFAWNYHVRYYRHLTTARSNPCHVQDRLPEGHGMVGVIGASDKTPLTIRT